MLFRLKDNLRRQLAHALKKKYLVKQDRTFKLLSFSLLELKEHLEKQFTPLMSWNNYGAYWEIDHKVPSSFASTKQELIDLFSLTNLQPLPKVDNCKKSNKQIGDLFMINGVDKE